MTSSKPKVLLTRVLPDPAMETLKTDFDLSFDPSDLNLTKAQIIAGIKNVDGIISMLSDVIDREVLGAGRHLKIVANYAVGYNNIDLNAAKTRKIAITNTPGVLTETTADLSWALMMAIARRLPEAHQRVQSGRWRGWAPTEFLGFDVFGKTLGIIGMGRIGQAVARRAAGFGMEVYYTSRHRRSEALEKKLGISYLSLQQLLKQSDYVSLHLPLSEGTRHLIDRDAFQRMKKTAFLINTSRGPIVDEAALCEALAEKRIAGAGLDVFEAEPELCSSLFQMKNVVTLPHIGSASNETRVKMGFMVHENLSACFAGQIPPNVVDCS